jgi:hypothetical protein
VPDCGSVELESLGAMILRSSGAVEREGEGAVVRAYAGADHAVVDPQGLGREVSGGERAGEGVP